MKPRALVLPSLLLAAFVINLDILIVNVALPTFVKDLHATNSELQWIVDGYNLLFAALLLAAGSLGDRFGRKGFLLSGLAVFGIASVAAGLTTSTGALIAARCVMGVGAAMIFPATLSLISNVFTDRVQRAKAIGLWGATAGMAIALGPIVGGWLLEHFSWPSIFYAMAPVAALAALLAAWSVPTSRDPNAHRKTDVLGLVLSSAAVAVLTYTVIEAPDHGWGSGRTVAGYLIAAALFAIFVLRERVADEPMLDVSLFKNLRFTAASGSVTIVFFGLSGFSFLMTQYFQFFRGYSPFSTGVHLLPVALSVGVMSVVGTKLAVNFGTKQIVTGGLFLLTIFFFWVATISPATSYLEIAGQMILGGSGVGLVSAPATEAIMGVVPRAKAGVGSAVNDATRLLGSTLGVAVIGSVYASIYRDHVAHRLPATLSGQSADAARDSVGGALTLATNSIQHGNAVLGSAVHAAASSSFFDGFNVAIILVAILSGVGGLMTLWLLPAQPLQSADSEAADVPVLALKAQ
jgi:EmrB/QacA subfamily drug resistance transporter